MAQMWQQNLGVTITVENIETNLYNDKIYAGQHGQLFDDGWCADYPDPENFADALFHSGAQQNLGNYSNPELDALLEQARVEQDVSRRIQLYQQAEQIIVNDAPALFTMHSMIVCAGQAVHPRLRVDPDRYRPGAVFVDRSQQAIIGSLFEKDKNEPHPLP